MWPDAPELRAYFARVSRRLSWISAAEGAAMGLILALVLTLAIRGRSGHASLAILLALGVLLTAIGSVVGRWRPWATGARRGAALSIEERAPHCRNVIVTAAEVIEQPARVRAYVGERVVRDATRLAGALDPAALFPATRAAAALGSSAMFWALSVGLVAGSPPPTGVASARAAVIHRVEITVTPPAYASRSEPRRFDDPSRIEALAGSRIDVSVAAHAAQVGIETLDGQASLAASGNGSFAGDLVAEADGFIAIVPTGSDGRAGARRLIGLSVTADAPPRVRLTAPGRDLFVPDAKRALDIAAEVEDDLGVGSLRMRYTKVSGSGERFTFADGEVPLSIERATDRRWTGRATWRLEALGLSPGDMVVYRAVAADRRPGAPPAESDAFIVEITAPGGFAALGFALDEELGRYALSQQMVILKSERLAARRTAMPAAAYADSALELAVEQRRVRAEFVFMMGGELADEVVAAMGITDLNEVAEAEGEADLAAGRLANQGRVALLGAIRSMSRASASLTTAELAQALVHERAALVHLERAFAHTRYILRALNQRERLDLSRRLSGSLSGVGRDVHPMVEAASDPRASELRGVLASIASFAGECGEQTGYRVQGAGCADADRRISSFAQRVIRVDPSSKPLQDVAAMLAKAGTAMQRLQAGEARAQLERAVTDLARVLRAQLPSAPPRTTTLDARRLEGALTDALRHPAVRNPR